MTDAEINAMAQGMMLYLMEQCPDTMDTLAVIVCMTLLYYEKAKRPDVDFPIEEYAKGFSVDIVQFWKSRTVINKGEDTIQ